MILELTTLRRKRTKI